AGVFVTVKAFPRAELPKLSLEGITVDEQGVLYVSEGTGIYRIDPKGKVTQPLIRRLSSGVGGLAMDGKSHPLAMDGLDGELLRIKLSDGTITKVASGFGVGCGVAWDHNGRLFLSDLAGGKVFA